MEIKYTTNGDTLTAKLYGDLDESTAEYIRMSLDTLLNETTFAPGAKVVVDLSHLTFMDSTGIGVLLGRYNKFAKRGIPLCLSNPPAHVDKILKMAGVYKLLPQI